MVIPNPAAPCADGGEGSAFLAVEGRHTTLRHPVFSAKFQEGVRSLPIGETKLVSLNHAQRKQRLFQRLVFFGAIALSI
jgi:hypothetical protein